MKTYDSTLFFHDTEKKVFIADAAELARCGEALFEAPARNHPASGLTIKSAKTGDTADFLIARVERDRDHDISCWLLTPTRATVDAHPELNDYTVTIFND